LSNGHGVLSTGCRRVRCNRHAQSAERNIEGRIDELSQAVRRQRQQEITDELLDVVSGFEALAGGRRSGGP
jgi:F0F1-type ATP synthase gamma subunit